MSALKKYGEAMVRGDYAACIDIEQRHGLYGYPPQIVSVGLQALDEGKDALDAVDAYLEEQQS